MGFVGAGAAGFGALAGAAETLVAGCERFVNKHAAIRECGQQGRKQRAMQIVGNDDCVKVPAGIRPWPVFEIGDTRSHAGYAGKPAQRLTVAVDGLDAMPEPGQMARMASAAAGDIEHPAAGTDQRREAAHPS